MSGGGFEFDMGDFLRHIDAKKFAVHVASTIALEDVGDDLARIASNIAPVKTGTLRMSIKPTRPRMLVDGVAIDVVASAVEESGGGRFNYALWTHESDYKLGESSAQAPGTDGYSVGNKYLERPLKGESQRYVDMMAREIEKVVDD